MLIYRLLTAAVLIPLVIAALFLLPLHYFAIVMVLLCTLGAWEWAQFTRFNSAAQRRSFALVSGLFFAFIAFLPVSIKGEVFAISLFLSAIWWIGALVMVKRYPASAEGWRNSTALKILFGALTLTPFLMGMLVLREQNYGINSYDGAILLLYVMVLVWSTDSGAYAAGRLLGKHKLLPNVSPGKTVEGLIGGLISAAIVAVIFNYIAPLQYSVVALVVSSLIAVLVSVLGDLAESMFKRVAKIKDSSQLIPGHGGILDRIDSLTAAIPVFAFILLLIF